MSYQRLIRSDAVVVMKDFEVCFLDCIIQIGLGFLDIKIKWEFECEIDFFVCVEDYVVIYNQIIFKKKRKV